MTGKTIATTPESALDVLRQIGDRLPIAQSSEDATEGIVARILSGETTEDVLTPSAAPSLGDFPGETFLVHGLRRVEGGLNRDTGFYLLIDATAQSTGRRGVYSSGATNIVAQLLKLFSMDALPAEVTVTHVASKSNPGNVIHWLTSPDRF